MRYRTGFLIFVALLISFTAGGAWAATVSGTVTNGSGKPNARVYIRATGSSGSWKSRGQHRRTGRLYDPRSQQRHLPVVQPSWTAPMSGCASPTLPLVNRHSSPYPTMRMNRRQHHPPAASHRNSPAPYQRLRRSGQHVRPSSCGRRPEDANGFQAAEAYNIYWSTNSLGHSDQLLPGASSTSRPAIRILPSSPVLPTTTPTISS